MVITDNYHQRESTPNISLIQETVLLARESLYKGVDVAKSQL